MSTASNVSHPRPDGQPERRSGWFGPGLLIAASFIGPGMVTTATVTGASYGYALMWAIVFSIVATIILQETSIRLGLEARLTRARRCAQPSPPRSLRCSWPSWSSPPSGSVGRPTLAVIPPARRWRSTP